MVPTCRRRLNGRQALKVLLLRNEVKKSGQALELKLLPMFVSKGLGIAELVPDVCAVNIELAVEDAIVVVAVSDFTRTAADVPPADDNAVWPAAAAPLAEDETGAEVGDEAELGDVVEGLNGLPLP